MDFNNSVGSKNKKTDVISMQSDSALVQKYYIPSLHATALDEAVLGETLPDEVKELIKEFETIKAGQNTMDKMWDGIKTFTRTGVSVSDIENAIKKLKKGEINIQQAKKLLQKFKGEKESEIDIAVKNLRKSIDIIPQGENEKKEFIRNFLLKCSEIDELITKEDTSVVSCEMDYEFLEQVINNLSTYSIDDLKLLFEHTLKILEMASDKVIDFFDVDFDKSIEVYRNVEQRNVYALFRQLSEKSSFETFSAQDIISLGELSDKDYEKVYNITQRLKKGERILSLSDLVTFAVNEKDEEKINYIVDNDLLNQDNLQIVNRKIRHKLN